VKETHKQFFVMMKYPVVLKLMNDCGFDRDMAEEAAHGLIRCVLCFGGSEEEMILELRRRIDIMQKFLSTE